MVGLKKQHFKKKTEWNYQKNFMTPFHGWGSTTSRQNPLWDGSLLYNTKFPETPGFPKCCVEKKRTIQYAVQ